MEDLKLLYQSYVDKKLISDKTTFEQFSSASPKQLDLLYRSGVDGKLVSQKTDFNTFSSAWGEKKKESSEVSPSRPSEKPFASATSPKPPIQPTFRTEAPDVFGGVKPVAKKAPEAPKDQLSPAAKAQVQARVARGEVAETPVKKVDVVPQATEPGPSSYLQAVEKEEFERANRVRNAVGDAESKLVEKNVDKKLSESFDLGFGPKPNIQTETAESVQVARKNANEEINNSLGVKFDLYTPNDEGTLVENEDRSKVLKDYLGKADKYQQFVKSQDAVDEAKRRQQKDPNNFPLTSKLLNSVPESLGLATALIFDAAGVGETESYSQEVRTRNAQRRLALGLENSEGITENLSKGNVGDAMKELMLAGADFVPQMAAFVINPAVGYAYNAASAGGSTYDQFRDRNDISKGDKMTLALISSVADLALNKLTMGAEKSIRASLGITAEELGTETAKKKALDYLNPLKNEVVGKGFLGEAAEEGGVNLINQIAANIIAGDEFDANSLIDEALIGGVFGSATVGLPKVLARGANGLANASMVSEFRKVTDQIKGINDALLNEELTTSQSELLTRQLEQLSLRQTEISNASEQLYSAMTKEDQDAVYGAHKQINEGLKTYNEAENKVVKNAAFSQVRQALIAKRDLENKYAGQVKAIEDDSQEEAGIPSPVVEGEAPVEAQPIEGTVQEAPEAGGVLQVPSQGKVDVITIAERQSEAESKIKRTDLFTGVGDFSTQLGGSDKAAVPVSHSENNQIEIVEYAHPETGSVDVIVTGKSDNNFVGFYRLYENGKPTNKWSSKFENQSRNKEDFKTMISGVQALLPGGHEYTEKTSISTDGLRVWNQQLSRGYELQYDENGNVITNRVYVNGDAIVNELGVNVEKGKFEPVRATEREFEKAKEVLVPYLDKLRLSSKNIYFESTSAKLPPGVAVKGRIAIDLPVLKSQSVEEGPEVASQIEATVFAAPFYDTKVNNIEEARAIRQTEPYVTNLETIRSASALFNVEIDGVDEAIGGFVNDAGDKIVEVSNIIRVKGTPEDVQNYAAFLATSSPETQEATIAATYVEQNSEVHNIDELTISVSDVDGAIEALKENDIYDFTINDSNNTITFLDFSKGADVEFKKKIGRFAKSLDAKNITNEEQDIRAIDSKYIGPSERTGILGQIQETLVQQGQTGTELYRQVEQAIARNQEFLDKTATPAAEAVATQEVAEQAPVENKTGLSSEQVTDAVSAAEGLAKRLGLSTKIVVHSSRKDFNDAMDEVSNSGSLESGIESGRFIPSTDEVHINLEDMTSRVPFHEVFHAAFVSRFSKGSQAVREKAASEFKDGVLRVLRAGTAQDRQLAAEVEQFVADGGYTARESPEEFMAQTAGFIANSGAKISKSTMDKLMQWLNNFIGKVIPSLKVTTRGEFIDFMNSFSGAMFESSTDKSLKDISEEGFYVPSEPVTMPDLSEPSSKRTFLDDAPAFIKDNIANLKALAGRKIPFAVFYDNLRVGKSTLRNSVTGKESNRNLMGGFGYSQLDGVKFEDDGARTAVLAFTSEDVTARKLSEFLRKDGDLVPIAMQNIQTGHLGNIDVVLDMFDPVEGVISTAPALYAQQQTGKDSGPEFEVARDAAEQEILGAIKQSVTELAAKPEKNPKKKDEPTERVKIALKIEPMLNDIKTLDDWRDKILLGAWDSFGARGLFNSYMLQAKPSKVTKSTRETHKILHGKYGVPTIKEVQDGMTENSLSNAELGDVVKFITIDDRAVIYTTDAKYSDLPAEGVEKKSDKISYTLKYIGDKVTPHASYPYIIAGKNDGFAPSYIDITEIFPDLKGKVKKSQSFYSAGRRSLAAPSGEVDATIAESSSMEALEPEKGKSLADIRKSYEKSITPKISPKTILEEAKKQMIDRQSKIKNAVLELGLRTAYDRIVNKAGASARANDKYRRAEKKIYSGLKESEIKTLDDIIFARRVIQIDSNFDKRMLDAEARLKSAQAELSTWKSSKIDKKSARAIKQEKAIREKISQGKKDVEASQRPKHPLGYQSENGVFELNQLKEKLGDKKYNDLIRRSDLYFDEFRSTLKDLFDAGLVTEQTYNELRTNNYQPRKFIEHVFDFNNSEFLIRDFGLSGEQIKAIGTGSTGDLIMSSRFLMGAYQLSASKRILSNRTNTAIAEAIGKKGANDWVRETGPDGVVDPGFVKVYYFVDGVQQEFQLRADLKAELDNSSALSNIDPRLSVALSIVSGAPLLKLMATRANPLFAFKNFPRDLGHILLFTNIYDKHSLPYATYLVLGDFIKGLKSSIQDTQDFQEYMDLGGGMDFISIQGRDGNFVSRGAISKTIDVIGKLGEWSEVGFRIGVYKRFKDDGIAAFEKNNDSKPTGEDLLRIKESAVAKAREIIDFSQGGSAVKAIDKFAPYLNAAFQGFRVAATYIANNPKKFASKFVQAQMGLLALAFYNLLIGDDDEMEDIPEHTRLMNFIIFLPFTRVDEDGKKRRKYILIPKTQQGAPFFALMDIANRKIINEVFGKEYSISKDEYTYMINGARKGLPIGDDSAIKELTSLVPVFNAAFTYQSGYDTFRDRMVSMDMGEVLPAYEGVNDPNVEQFYKVLGEINGWSPIRTKTAVEKIITSPSSSFIVGMSYGILDAVARQYPLNSGDYNIKTSESKMKNLAEQTGLNFSKAFVRETDPSWGLFNQKETLDNIDMAAGTERARLRAKAKELSLGTNDPVKMEKSKAEAIEMAREIAKKNPIDAKYFLQSFKSNLGEAPSSQQSVEIQYSADDKARAKKIKLLYNPQNREDYMKIMRDVRKETGYTISAKTFYEYETAYGKLQ